MKIQWITLLLGTAVGVGLAGTVLAGEHEEIPAAPTALYTPGPEHAEMAKMAGEWNAKMSFNMPGMPDPVVTKNTESGKMVMNGWFLQSDFDGTFQDEQGNVVPWKGRTIQGYNLHSKEHEVVWYSELGSAISIHKGKKCPKGILHLYGSMPHYETQKMTPTRMQIHPADESGAHSMEMHWLDGDKQPTSQIMKIEYTKK